MRSPSSPTLHRIGTPVIGALLSCMAMGACHKQPEPEAPVARIEEEPSAPERPEMDVASEIGGMNQEKVARVFRRIGSDLAECIQNGSERIEFLGGSVSFYLLIDQEGHLAHGHVKESTIGDRITESCMLDVLAAQEWPRPVGGKKGKIEYDNIRFEPSGDVRPPVEWSSDDIADQLEELSKDLNACKNGSHGSYVATMYVDTHGDPLAVGMAPPDEYGAEAVDCLVSVLEQAKFRSPGSWPAKVTFHL